MDLTNANWTICYFFFQENNYSLRTVTSALCALLLQLFDDESSLLVHAVKEYRIKGQKFAEDFHALSRIFGQVVQHHPREKVICIIDGLDECEETGRDLLIDRWNKLKFFVTSRYGWIERRFTHSSILRPDAAAVNKAVNKEIAIVVESEVSELGLRMKLSAELQTTLKARLVANAGHTFLWVSLTLDQFRRRKDFTGSEKQCWAILNDLPADLNAAYERILKRSTDRRLAQKILHIIIAAARPLTLVEIGIALAIEVQSKSTKDLQSSRFPFIESSIQDICGGLVKIIGTRPNQKIDLVHHTAKEFLVTRPSQPMPRDQGFLALSIWAIYCVYFPVIDFLAKFLGLWKHSLDPVESDRVLAEICVTYLFFEEFSNCPLVMNHEAKAIDIRGTVDRYAREYDFLDYAATHWATHFRKSQYRAQATLMQAALELCDTKSKKFQTWFGVYWALVDSLWPCPENLTALMAGSLCGHKRLVEFLLRSHEVDIVAKDDSGRTALMWAVENGHEDVAHLLLQNGADVNAKDTNEWNALHKAIEKGYKELAQLLQVNGADVSAVTQRGHSGIHFAARNGFHDLVQLMLDCEVDVNMRSAVGEIGKCTAMHFAAMNGHKEVVSLLLENGADVNAETGLIGENLAQYTPLHFAVVEGHLEVAELLLENGGLLAARDAMGETPLHKAASSGHEEMTALLLSKATFVDIDSKTETGETPLHLAVKKKDHAAATCLLLKGNASVREKDKNGALALHYAAAKGNHVAVRELIARGAKISARDYDQKSILHYAARCQEHTVALILLEENADIEAQDADEMTALHDAAVHGNDDVVAFLLSKGANPCARDYDGKTALHHAVAKGRDAVFRLLLANPDVDPNSRDNAGRTPLSWAVPNFYRSENVVEQMLRCERIHPDSRDNDGRTPLSWAVQFMQINDPVASLLIDIGRVDPDSRDNNGRTPLSWTVQHIHSDIPAASLLLETGRVDPDSRDNNGRTPLSWAVQFMHSNDIGQQRTDTPLSWAVQSMKIDDPGPSLLLGTGRVDPDSKDKYGRTPLSWAVQNDQHDQWDHEAAVKFLLGTERVDINSKDMDGRTPLSWATGKNKSKIIQLLVKTDGIQPDLPDINGRTPLSWAAQYGDPHTVKVLLDTGRVAPEKCDGNGRTPLIWAREKGNNDVFDLLIRYQRRYVYKDQLGAIDGRYEMEIGYESGDQMEESEELGRRYSI
ncbi:Ankyrin repeat-containing domain protein [Penicillium manginii]|uniref:Ankyrin repeat-containing domain protein n=1 Tax=Penicillium manginii TaxID=203109 RepID=UPI00254822B2|nr:Ankyrin repeat-containing domain protein [Penicillium manginii]KAJ5742080.1 Ankyrin repeat-containing domain protein [Penicillium manginii]